MEVHAHTHTPRKKWTHYFWEFLMLFLAVFCGFLAELQLEHYVEHKRELQYAATLTEDLKADTAQLGSLRRDLEFVIPRMDTFRQLVHDYELNELPSGVWYYYGRFGTRNVDISFQGATLQQLLSSGGLRYFKKQQVANTIARYAMAVDDLKSGMYIQNFLYNEVIKDRNQVFDTYYMDPVMSLTISPSVVDSFKKQNPPLLSDRKRDFIVYANSCQMKSNNLKNRLRNVRETQKKAFELILLLQRTYKIK
ncbi:MAG: hypothetical protein ACO25B_06175 [Chitinophagaceae bacterium]